MTCHITQGIAVTIKEWFNCKIRDKHDWYNPEDEFCPEHSVQKHIRICRHCNKEEHIFYYKFGEQRYKWVDVKKFKKLGDLK